MKGLIPVLLLISVLLISGCTAPQTPSDTTGGETGGETPVTAEPSVVQGVDQGMSGVSDISSDLDISDMDALESDLSGINW
jgi:hypothetical protein